MTQELEDWEWHENRDLESKVVLLILLDLVTFESMLHIYEFHIDFILENFLDLVTFETMLHM